MLILPRPYFVYWCYVLLPRKFLSSRCCSTGAGGSALQPRRAGEYTSGAKEREKERPEYTKPVIHLC